MNDNVDIYINAYKDFSEYPHSQEYKIITTNEIPSKDIDVIYEKDDELLPFNQTICEFTRMFYVYKNCELKKYVGFCQYRRYFDFYDNVPNLDEIFQEHDIITARPIYLLYPLETHYSIFHNVEDLNLLDTIINEKCGSTVFNKWRIYRHMNVFFTNNMFIMKKDDFVKYMEFMIPIVKSFIVKRGWESYSDAVKWVENHKNLYLKDFYPNETVDYQSRMMAYVIERLTSFYIISTFIRPKMYDIKITEEKYFVNLPKNRIFANSQTEKKEGGQKIPTTQ